MANGDLLIEIKQYAENEDLALPAKLFQRLVLKSVAQLLDDRPKIIRRLDEVEQRHRNEDKGAEKKDKRGWELKLLLIGYLTTFCMGVVSLWLGLK